MTAKTITDKKKKKRDLGRKNGEKVRYIILIEWGFKPEIVTIEQIEEIETIQSPDIKRILIKPCCGSWGSGSVGT